MVASETECLLAEPEVLQISDFRAILGAASGRASCRKEKGDKWVGFNFSTSLEFLFQVKINGCWKILL